jgi:hypothetical protein
VALYLQLWGHLGSSIELELGRGLNN